MEKSIHLNKHIEIIQHSRNKKLKRKTEKMSVEEAEPPQYIITAPGDENNEDDDDKSSTTTTASTATTKSTVNVSKTQTNKSHNTRSQSLQSSSSHISTTLLDQQQHQQGHPQQLQLLTNASSLMQQLKAQSSMNIVTEKHVQKYSSTQSTTSCSSTTSMTGGTKTKFTSFLQHPDPGSPSHGGTFLTAQQKHVRQFVRSTSAHSSTESTSSAISGKADKCIRSTSQQIDDDHHSFTAEHSAKSLQQSAAILISKSAETIEGFRASSSTSGMRTQLTLSGGFLAPPNRKLTILSPVHAPPGLHELLRKHRSPLSPRISFPGTEAELFP